MEPATERMLALQPGERVLDVACGAGRFARRMAASGAQIVAFDHSERFIERARLRTTETRRQDRVQSDERHGHGCAAVTGQGAVSTLPSVQWP